MVQRAALVSDAELRLCVRRVAPRSNVPRAASTPSRFRT